MYPSSRGINVKSAFVCSLVLQAEVMVDALEESYQAATDIILSVCRKKYPAISSNHWAYDFCWFKLNTFTKCTYVSAFLQWFVVGLWMPQPPFSTRHRPSSPMLICHTPPAAGSWTLQPWKPFKCQSRTLPYILARVAPQITWKWKTGHWWVLTGSAWNSWLCYHSGFSHWQSWMIMN